MKTSGSKLMKTRIVNYLLVVTSLVVFAISPLSAAEKGLDEKTRFIVSKDTVIDNRTGLMWAVNDNRDDINWQDSHGFCAKFRGGGFSDWRMPTQDELATLYDFDPKSKRDYSIPAVFKITGSCLWGSDKKKATVAIFDYYYGSRDWGHPNSIIEARVLPVRKMKKK